MANWFIAPIYPEKPVYPVIDMLHGWHISQFQSVFICVHSWLKFLGGERGLAAFQKILFAGARGLDHLVHRAVAPGEIFVRKAEDEVIDHLGFVEGVERLVIAARGDDGMGIRRQRLPATHMLRIIPIVFHGSPDCFGCAAVCT